MNFRSGRIFIVAYDFPPRVRSGSYRPMRFARALSRRGREVHVVTAEEWEDPRRMDSSLLGEWAAGIRVWRTFSLSSLLDPLHTVFSRVGMGGLIHRMRKMFLFPDEKVLWALSVLPLLYRLRLGRGDVLLTSSPPWSVHLIGLVFRKFRRITWIADHRDAWTQNPHFRGKGPVACKLHRYMESTCHSYSDAVITASHRQRNKLVRTFGIEESNVLALYSGFDEVDFNRTDRGSEVDESADPDPFIICYAGALYQDYFPGAFLEALSMLVNEKCELRKKVRAVFLLSDGGGEIEKESARLGLDDIVKVHSAVSHSDLPACLLAADALLLVVPPAINSEAWVPAKTFEYLASDKPVLAIVPENSEVAGLVGKYGKGVISDSSNPLGVKNALERIIQGGGDAGGGDVHDLEWNNLSKQLVDLVETISPFEGTGERRPVSVALASSGLGIVERGVERFTEELGKALSADFRVSVYGGGSNNGSHTGIACVSRNNRLVVNFMRILPRAFQRLVKRLHLDPVEIEKLTFSLGTLIALDKQDHDLLVQSGGFWGAMVSNLAGRLYGLKVISIGHGGLGGAIEELSVSSDQYVTVNPSIVDDLKRLYPGRRITFLPTIVDTAHFKPGRPRVDLVMERPVYLAVGSLEPDKRIDLAVNAVARLGRGSLLVLGTGPLEEEIRTLGRSKLGLCRFFLWHAPKEKMVDYYNFADVFTMPSVKEAFPLAMLEALSCDLPVVTIREGSRALLSNGNVIYCNPENEEQYSSALARAAQRKFSGKSRERAMEFSCDRVKEQWGALISEVSGR